APFLRRLRQAGHDPRPFRRHRIRGWVVLGLLAAIVLAVAPLHWAGLYPVTERLATLLALLFLLATAGLAMGMHERAFAVSGTLVLGLYGLTAWTRFAFRLEDFFVVALLVSFGIFALAGFNLVFVLEEMVFDLHRQLGPHRRAWDFL